MAAEEGCSSPEKREGICVTAAESGSADPGAKQRPPVARPTWQLTPCAGRQVGQGNRP